MTTLEAIDILISSADQTWWRGTSGDPDQAALLTVAEASLSGALEECGDEATLREAVDHGRSLVNSGIIAIEDIANEACRIDDELQEWGQKVDADARRIAESN